MKYKLEVMTTRGYKKKQQQHGNYTLEILANTIPLPIVVLGNASKLFSLTI